MLRLAGYERRVLVATDCLSEGINLQDNFSAVIHYDLPWNPTRLDQREGRVDRYGQAAPEVKVLTIYGADNQIDTLILEVLVRKHRTIRATLGTQHSRARRGREPAGSVAVAGAGHAARTELSAAAVRGRAEL